MSGSANRSGAVAILPIIPQQQQQQTQMSSVPPPPMGPGGHPRYSQHMERGYGGPPPGPPSYGNSYSSYPPQYGAGNYGSMPQGGQPGYPPRANYPPSYGPGGYGATPGGFPPQHHPPYYGGQGGYEGGHYGGQPPPQPPQASYRGPSPVPRAQPSAPPTKEKPRSSPTKSPEQKAPSASESTTVPDHGEVERLRAAAAQELTTEEVKPIQTDFHFFVKEHLEEFRKLAEEEVKKSLKEGETELDPLLVNSNLNTRLMKAWEDLTKEDRDAYMVKEEADRRRFMEDDEIASRHCATLTARGKSPRVVGGETKVKKEESEIQKEDEETTEEPKRPVPEAEAAEETHESPTKKPKADQ